jgi:hypothetical protein
MSIGAATTEVPKADLFLSIHKYFVILTTPLYYCSKNSVAVEEPEYVLLCILHY